MPRILSGSLRSSVWAVSPRVRRWALALWAVAAGGQGAAAGAVGGPLTGLAAAAGVLAGLGTFAVACQTGVLAGARAAPGHRLLADVTPAYVASLRYRPYRLDGEPAWFGADFTAYPRGRGYGAALLVRLKRLATVNRRLLVIRAANWQLAGTLYADFTPLPGQENARRPLLVWRPPGP